MVLQISKTILKSQRQINNKDGFVMKLQLQNELKLIFHLK